MLAVEDRLRIIEDFVLDERKVEGELAQFMENPSVNSMRPNALRLTYFYEKMYIYLGNTNPIFFVEALRTIRVSSRSP